VLPSLVINVLSLLYSASQFVTARWCEPSQDEVDEFHPLLQAPRRRDDATQHGAGGDDALPVAPARAV
jgi:hypothetical protein